jgi:hypothetical protein
MKQFQNIFTLLTVFIIFSQGYSQTTKYTGYFCTGVNEFSPFKYSREYKNENDTTYVTLYKIYSPTDGYYLNIKATHYTTKKQVVVDIDDISIKVGGHISTQEIFYEEPSLKMFGRQGSFKASFDAQNVLPNELALKFLSEKYQNIKVVYVVKDNSFNATKWYVLDEKN